MNLIVNCNNTSLVPVSGSSVFNTPKDSSFFAKISRVVSFIFNFIKNQSAILVCKVLSFFNVKVVPLNQIDKVSELKPELSSPLLIPKTSPNGEGAGVLSVVELEQPVILTNAKPLKGADTIQIHEGEPSVTPPLGLLQTIGAAIKDYFPPKIPLLDFGLPDLTLLATNIIPLGIDLAPGPISQIIRGANLISSVTVAQSLLTSKKVLSREFLMRAAPCAMALVLPEAGLCPLLFNTAYKAYQCYLMARMTSSRVKNHSSSRTSWTLGNCIRFINTGFAIHQTVNSANALLQNIKGSASRIESSVPKTESAPLDETVDEASLDKMTLRGRNYFELPADHVAKGCFSPTTGDRCLSHLQSRLGARQIRNEYEQRYVLSLPKDVYPHPHFRDVKPPMMAASVCKASVFTDKMSLIALNKIYAASASLGFVDEKGFSNFCKLAVEAEQRTDWPLPWDSSKEGCLSNIIGTNSLQIRTPLENNMNCIIESWKKLGATKDEDTARIVLSMPKEKYPDCDFNKVNPPPAALELCSIYKAKCSPEDQIENKRWEARYHLNDFGTALNCLDDKGYGNFCSRVRKDAQS